MRVVLLCISLLLLTWSCAQNKTKHITEVSQSELKSVVLVDVRTPKEFEQGHLENARNINWFDDDFVDHFKGIDKEETIYLYCRVGGRSAKAQEKLLSIGYKNVVNLEGGYDALKKENPEPW